ncbi:hypothetical protein BFW01_g2297 [Lasiodiplodia theobromae]|uniref:Apple domain-containing protein n=1 Tax=Lasiodiplodia theobromae TaxID=45133 RepID=A0A5N5DJF2_9PEZI|nr:uncharacterized protein LTHEOB_395 [Lasiodiplodia theobromae]KAB2577062.1 hypothetical protein DBV05_g4297 [Lasiodiplodia theobromae]KAF4543696.1 hypothetical protein LTHEOB_395 [Lasiodiplodia theobromae]KAF9631435.1 hypothetical protein BFW01_g2297 [Lasiodiplodia theobromae]
MRAAALIPLAIGLVAAGPVEKRQNFNFAAIAADRADEIAAISADNLGPVDPVVLATTVVEATSAYDATAAIAAATSAVTAVVEKREACQTYSGAGPVVTSAPSDWVNAEVLTNPALTADVPSGYEAAPSFTNLQGAVQQMGYLTVKTLDSYSPAQCASYCDDEPLCMGFNVYFERDPSEDTSCASDGNPDSITTIACTLYAYHVAASKATNTGQYRDNFQVVITGSNGYNKDSSKQSFTSIDGYQAPQNFEDACINAPTYNDFDSYITYTTYTDAYDPRVCAKACDAQTEYDKEHPNDDQEYKACNYFVAYVMAKNEEPQGLFCALYSLPWNSTYAVNTGYSWSSDVYTIYNSLAYTVSGDLDFGNNEEIEDFVYEDAN